MVGGVVAYSGGPDLVNAETICPKRESAARLNLIVKAKKGRAGTLKFRLSLFAFCPQVIWPIAGSRNLLEQLAGRSFRPLCK